MSTKTLAATVVIVSLALLCACGGSSSSTGTPSGGGVYDIVVAGGYGGPLLVFKDVLNRPSPIISADVVISESVASLNGRLSVENDVIAVNDDDSNGVFLWNGVSTLVNDQPPTLQVGSDWYYSVHLYNGDLYATESNDLHIWRDVLTKAPNDPPDEVWSSPTGKGIYYATTHLGRLYVTTNDGPDEIYIMNDAESVTAATVPDAILPALDWARRLYFNGGTMYQPLMSGGLIASWSNIATATTGTNPDGFVLTGMDEYTSMTFGGGRAWLAEMWANDAEPVFSSFVLGAAIGDNGPTNEDLFLDMAYQIEYKPGGLLFGTAGETTGGCFWYYDAARSLLGDPDGWAIDPRMENAKEMYIIER